jgi:Ca2+-binding RTX toxin-like protein
MQRFSTQRSSLVSFDSLEPRMLRAGDSPFTSQLDDGTVLVTGTDGKDSIHVFHPNFDAPGTDYDGLTNGNVMVIRVNGIDASYNMPEPDYDPNAVRAVQIRSEGGNDSVIIDHSLGFAALPFYVNGGSGNDTIIGSDGDDTLTGAGGRDYIDGRGGRDRLNGLDANDWLIGNKGVDRIFGGAGNDLIDGGASTDYLFGEGGNDTILGSDGDDSLDGGGGDDSLLADGGDDTVIGGSGNDTLDGGTGHDTVFGNAGDDTLQLRDLTFDLADAGSGIDKAFIDDFERTFIVAETKIS